MSHDGRWVAGGGKDGSVLMWDLTSSTNRLAEYRTPLNGVGSFHFSPDGRLLAVKEQGRLKLYDATTFQLVSEPALTLTNIFQFAFSPNSRLLVAVSGFPGYLGCWDLQEQRLVTNFLANAVKADFVSSGQSVLINENINGHGFTEWDIATWQPRRQWRPFTNNLFWAYSSATDLLGIAAMSRDGACALVPIRDPDKERRFTGQTRIGSVAFSPDGKTLAAASQDGTVELWDTETLTRQALLRGVVDSGFSSVEFSPDGQRVMAGGDGKESIKLWDLHSHEDVATLTGEGRFFHAKFSPDGNTIAARNGKGLLHVWTAPAWSEIEAAEKGRNAVSPGAERGRQVEPAGDSSLGFHGTCWGPESASQDPLTFPVTLFCGWRKAEWTAMKGTTMKRFVETMQAACAMNEPRIVKKHFPILRLTAMLLLSLMFV